MSRYIDAEKLIGDLIFSSKEFERVFKEIINDAPTADVEEVKHGKWIEDNDIIISGHCSCCGWNAILDETDVIGMPYCPNCGAKMDKEQEE